jgi:hypothetical protein
MIDKGVLVPSDYHITHPILLVPKKLDGKVVHDKFEWRLFADLQVLNRAIKPPQHAMKEVDRVVKKDTDVYHTTMDGLKGYWQLPVHEDSMKYTTISTPWD